MELWETCIVWAAACRRGKCILWIQWSLTMKVLLILIIGVHCLFVLCVEYRYVYLWRWFEPISGFWKSTHTTYGRMLSLCLVVCMYLMMHWVPLMRPSLTSMLLIKSYCWFVMSVIFSGSPPVWLIFLLEIAAAIFVSSIFDMELGRMLVHVDSMVKFDWLCLILLLYVLTLWRVG